MGHPLESTIAKLLIRRKMTLAVAESCTGGLVSNRLTDIAGSSKYFILGLVAYANRSKISLLGVSEKSIAKHGAVSMEVARQMAEGIRLLASTDIGIGITGIAGPTGGTRTKPVGTVYIALSQAGKDLVRKFRFKGSREEIKFHASQAALELICAYLSP